LNKFIVTLLQASVAVGAVKLGVPVHSIVAFTPCPPIVGGVVSVTVIVCDTVAEVLPQPSTAFHILVSLYPHVPVAVTSLSRFTVTLLHASVAVGAVKLGVPVHSIVVFAPCPPITGGVVSAIVIV